MKLLLFPIFYPRLAVLVVALLLYIVFGGQAKAMDLRQNAVIETPVITLGDIFTDLPHSADKVLGPAPRPGSEMVLNARTLLRVAMALDLPWRPASSNDQIVLTRAATLISQERVKTAVTNAIREQGYHGAFDLSFGAQAAEMILPADQPDTFDITHITANPQTDRFEATIAAPSADNPLQTIRVSGQIHPVELIPVLKSSLRNGTTITASDIETIQIRTAELQHDVILNADELIGTTPRRMLNAGKPVKAGEIEQPRVVQRGQTITMVFKSGGMELTAMGKALENGAKGDIIRVVNTGSNRTIQGIVSAEKEVTVRTF